MAVTRLPPVTLPRIVVSASMPGLPPAEIRTLVVMPLEDALASVRGVRNMYSVIRSGGALLTLEFGWNDNTLSAAARVREIIDTVYPLLPDGAAKPEVLPAQDEDPLLVYSLDVKGSSLSSIRDSGEDELKSTIAQVSGVSQVLVSGGMKREVEIRVDQEKVMARGSSMAEVARALAEGHTNMPAGEIREANRVLIVIARGRCISLEALAGLYVTGENGYFSLGEVAEIREVERYADSIFVHNGAETVGLFVYRKHNADPARTAGKVARVIDDFVQMRNPLYTVTLVKSAVRAVVEGVSDLVFSALAGALAVFVILFMLLRSYRSGLIVAVTIPLSAAVSVVALACFGKTLNILSLGGIAVAVGMISDNAVVVLAALEQATEKKHSQLTLDEASEETAKTVGSTFGSTITTAIVFVPVLAMPSALGVLYSDLAVGLVSALASGWICSFAVVPCMWVWLCSEKSTSKPARHKRLEDGYSRLLRRFLRHPALALALGFVFCTIGTALLVSRPFEFFPENLSRTVVVSLEFPRGTQPEAIISEAKNLYKEFSALHCDGKPLIEGQLMIAGAEAEDTGTRALPDYKAETLTIELRLAKGFVLAQAAPLLDTRLKAYGGSALSWSIQAPKDSLKEILSGSRVRGLAVYGNTPDEAEKRAKELAESAYKNGEAHASKVTLFPAELEETLVLYPERSRTAVAGFTTGSMALQCNMASAGSLSGTIEIQGRLVPLRLRGTGSLTDAPYFTVGDILSLPLSENSSVIQTKQLTRAQMETHLALLLRSNRNDTRFVSAAGEGASGGTSGGVYAEDAGVPSWLSEAARGLPWVEDVRAKANAEFAKTSLTLTAIAVLLLFLVLAAQFESFEAAGMLLLCVPLSLAGAGPLLALLGIRLDSGSILGLVILLGTAVNNAIILYEASRQYAKAGKPPVASAYCGAVTRIRSVASTTLTTVIALVPMLSSMGSTQRSLAAALLGGLVVSTLMTIFLYPLIFLRTGFSERSVSR